MLSRRSRQAPQMSRAARTLRGAVFAGSATLLAAVSHGVAGGVITPVSVLATAVLALPICVALAGRTGSLWRMALAITLSQFLYHWTFAGLGLATGRDAVAPAGPHAGHAAFLTSLPPELIAAGAADGIMWLSHAAAAVLTTALLYRGELAVSAFGRLVFRVVSHRLRLRPIALPKPVIRAGYAREHGLSQRLVCLSTLSHRGPPANLRLSH